MLTSLTRLKIVFKAAAACLAFALFVAYSPWAQAQSVRCTNTAGAVIAYAESAAYCPKEASAASTVAPASQPTAAQSAQAQKLAQSTKAQADGLEAARLKEERAQAKANAIATQKNASAQKKCKKQALNIEEAAIAAEEARLKALKKGATIAKDKSKQKAGKPSSKVTSQRSDDEPHDKAYIKAKRKLALLQAKRDLDCK